MVFLYFGVLATVPTTATPAAVQEEKRMAVVAPSRSRAMVFME